MEEEDRMPKKIFNEELVRTRRRGRKRPSSDGCEKMERVGDR
jgi:hypothetical protein